MAARSLERVELLLFCNVVVAVVCIQRVQRFQFLQDGIPFGNIFTIPGLIGALSLMDRLTGLPDGVIEKILLKIPTFDAVRTCVLSKHWRYKWIMLPKLVLDVSFILQARSIKEEPPFDYFHIVNTLLVQHKGPLEEFYLAIPDLPCPQRDYISQAKLAVMMKSIKKITILKWGIQPYSWPLSISFSPNLTYLELRNCMLKQESFSRGFLKLSGLVLDNVRCDPGTLSCCIANSPKLEKIILNLGTTDDTLIICAPMLEYLFVNGVCKCIYPPKSNKLREMEINLRLTQFQWWNEAVLNEFFGNLSLLESLSLNADIYSLFTDLQLHKTLPNNLGQLKIFRLTSVNFWNDDMLRVILCIIHSSPCLQRLEIIATAVGFRKVRRTVSMKMYKDSRLVHLKTVYIGLIQGTKNELSVIQNLLRCSPALQEMSIRYVHVEGQYHKAFDKALAQYRRAYPTVVINVLNHDQEFCFKHD